MREIISTDLGGLDDNRFYTPEVWNIIEENGQAAISLLISRVIPNRDKFYGVVEKKEWIRNRQSLVGKSYKLYS